MEPVKKYYTTLAQTMIANLSKRGMDGYYAETKEDALKTALSLINSGASVSWGGSMSINEIGLLTALKETDCVILDRTVPKTPAEKKEFFSKVAVCDYYLMSTNAITVDGELVNIDGNGNRVASLIFGPSHVIIIAGMNKVTKSLDAAVERARHIAAPKNTARLGKDTPCTETGFCCNCMKPDCICNQFVVTRRSAPAGRIKVILVGEELGY